MSVLFRDCEGVIYQYKLDTMWYSFEESNAIEQIGISLVDAIPKFKELQLKGIIEFSPKYADGVVYAIGAKLTPFGKRTYELK
jgi:hypothetical protein